MYLNFQDGWLISTRFIPLSRRFSPSRAYFTHFRFHSLPLSLSPTKVTTTLSNGAISIPRCTKHEQRSHIHVVRSRERTKSTRLPGLKRGSISGGATDSTRVSDLPPEKSRLVERVNNSRTRFQYFIFHVQFFFFYIYSHIESVDIHSWQIRKNWFQNRNRSLCELCIQGAICEKHTCRVVFCSILYISLFCIFFCSYYPSSCLNSSLLFTFSLFRSFSIFSSAAFGISFSSERWYIW